MALARFTPSLLSHQTLEKLFVARAPLLETVMGRVADSADTEVRNHTLLVGPRGAGKTHFISLVHHRTRDLMTAGTRLQVAWMPEDPWTIASYKRLLQQIVGLLEFRDGPDPRVLEERELEQEIARAARDHGTIVLLLENLDRVLNQIDPQGQQRLRSLLQRHSSLLIIGTTTTLDRTLADQAQPFYNFFTTTRLAPFTVSEAREMLVRIAVTTGDEALAQRLRQDERVPARLQVIAHLTGGQPRLWAALAAALTLDQLDSLVELLLTRFDDLTPYYQEQLGRLSTQQRLVVAELAALDHPIHVAELAQLLDIDQRSVAKTISDLADTGWVAPTTSPVVKELDRRRTYYELAEPLVRLSFQIKEFRGKPLRLIIEFLKGWFEPEDLAAPGLADHEYVAVAVAELGSGSAFQFARRLSGLSVTKAPNLDLLARVDDAIAALAAGDAEAFLSLPSAIRSAIEGMVQFDKPLQQELLEIRTVVHRSALDDIGQVPTAVTVDWIDRSRTLGTNSADVELDVIHLRWLARGWRFDEASAVLDALIGNPTRDSDVVSTARNDLAYAYESAGHLDKAITLHEQNLADLERILGTEHPDTLTSRNNLAYAYASAGHLDKAITLHEQNLADTERILGTEHPVTLTSRNNLAYAYASAGHLDKAITLHEQNLADTERILGTEHPDTLTSRNNLASTYESAGQLDKAITLFEQNLADRERILGTEHPDTLNSRNNLASASKAAGQR